MHDIHEKIEANRVGPAFFIVFNTHNVPLVPNGFAFTLDVAYLSIRLRLSYQ